MFFIWRKTKTKKEEEKNLRTAKQKEEPLVDWGAQPFDFFYLKLLLWLLSEREERGKKQKEKNLYKNEDQNTRNDGHDHESTQTSNKNDPQSKAL